MAQKTRAALTIFAIAWGTLAIILMLAEGEGLKRTLIRGTLGAGQWIVQVYGGETAIPFGTPEGPPDPARRGRSRGDQALDPRGRYGQSILWPECDTDIRLAQDEDLPRGSLPPLRGAAHDVPRERRALPEPTRPRRTAASGLPR